MSRRSRINPAHTTQRATARTLGILLVVVGAIFSLIGFVDFFGAFGGNGIPTKFWCLFVGFPLLGIGSALLKVGYLGAMTRYVAGETAPVVKDTFDYLADGTAASVKKTARAVHDGLRDDPDAARHCAKCGDANAADARFCDACGASLALVCAGCGEDNAGDARFCRHCGGALTVGG